jgi:hypothetical protein
MKPVLQTQFAGTVDAPTDEIGNCYQAAIASVLELDLDDVPHFIALHKDEWWIETVKWMNARGKGVAWIPIEDGLDSGIRPIGYHLMNGKSPRGDYGHEVVGLDGKVVHDPHPSGDGIESVVGWTIIYDMKEDQNG